MSQHADAPQPLAIMQKPGILKNWTCASKTPRSFVSGASDERDAATKDNTELNAQPLRGWDPRAKSTPICPSTRQASRRDSSHCDRQYTTSRSRHSHAQSRRSQSRIDSYFSATNVNKMKLYTQGLRSIVRGIERFQSTPTYSVSPLSYFLCELNFQRCSTKGKDTVTKFLTRARQEIATYKSFISHYHQSNRNGTPRRSLAETWFPPSSAKSRSKPYSTSVSRHRSSMPIAPCCSRQAADITSLHLPTNNPKNRHLQHPTANPGRYHLPNTPTPKARATKPRLAEALSPTEKAHAQQRPARNALGVQLPTKKVVHPTPNLRAEPFPIVLAIR